MDLQNTLIVGSYLWTTALAAWFDRRLCILHANHLHQLNRRVTQLERKTGISGPAGPAGPQGHRGPRGWPGERGERGEDSRP